MWIIHSGILTWHLSPKSQKLGHYVRIRESIYPRLARQYTWCLRRINCQMGWVYLTWNLTDPESSLEGAADGMAQVKKYCKDISCGRCAYAHEDDDVMTLRDLSTFATFGAPFKAFGPIQTNKMDKTLRPRKLTWQWKTHHLKMYFLWLKMEMFQCHVSFQGCSNVVMDKPHELTSCLNKLASRTSATPRWMPKKKLTRLRQSCLRFQCNNRWRFFSHGWSSQPHPPKK